MHAAGEPESVRHFHDARLSVMNVDLGPLRLAVTTDRIITNLGERFGNIWMAELREGY